MKTSPSAPLSRYLSLQPDTGKPRNPTNYLVDGAACVNTDDLSGLHRLLPQVRKKTAAITDSDRLRRRLVVLADYYQESSAGDSPVRREIAFVLYYFLKGYDLIPDSIPEIGLLDDALLVESVLRRNQHALSSHWTARGRDWPEIV
ncbi:MAG: DUF1232 domain-containing protein [bacterium]|nr:DUF1232 domain-containing protein [bacterium]MDI1337183.1 DUF1232 domain-containing protein [Lacunisphaera sp.]